MTDDRKTIMALTVFGYMIENTELDSAYRISDVQLISYTNRRKINTSHLTQIGQHNLEILQLKKISLRKKCPNTESFQVRIFLNYQRKLHISKFFAQCLLKKCSSNSLEIDEEAVFAFINLDTLNE